METIEDIVAPYDDYNRVAPHTEYIWVRRGQYYDYVHRTTATVVRLPAVVLAYDSDTGMFGREDNDVVTFYDKHGNADMEGLRRRVREAGGYLALDNYTLHIKHYIDIYGNILNL